MSTETPETRFCPECSAAVSATARRFETPLACTSCGRTVTFVDYARAPVLGPSQTARKQTTTWADHAFRLLAIVAALGTLVAAYSLLTEQPTGTFWGGVGCLAAALPLALRFAHLQRQLLHVTEHAARTERSLVLTNAKLAAAAEVNKGFQKNLANVAADERRRVQVQNVTQLTKIAEKKEDVDWRLRRTEDQNRVVKSLGDRIICDVMDRIVAELTARNFDSSRRRLAETIAFCRENDYNFSPRKEEDLVAQLTHRYNQELRIEQERQRRDAIGARLRAEQRAHEQMEHEITRVEAQRSAIRRQMSEAQAASDTAESSSTTLKRLKSQLQAVEEKAKQATTMARNARSGHVLVLSNVGSFGEGVYKICMSRQVDPNEAIREMSREATPFPFDVHMIVSTDDASELIGSLHESLHDYRVNRVDLGKDFFRTDMDTIWRLVVANHSAVQCRHEAPAEEFRESETMSDEQFRHITEMMRRRENWSDEVGTS